MPFLARARARAAIILKKLILCCSKRSYRIHFLEWITFPALSSRMPYRVSPSSRYTESPIGNKVVRQRNSKNYKNIEFLFFKHTDLDVAILATVLSRCPTKEISRGFPSWDTTSFSPNKRIQLFRIRFYERFPSSGTWNRRTLRVASRHVMQRVRCTSHVHAARAMRQDNFPPGVLCLIVATMRSRELIGGKIHFIALIVRHEARDRGRGGWSGGGGGEKEEEEEEERRTRGRTPVNARWSGIGEKYMVDHRGRAPAARLTSSRYIESPFRRYFRNYMRQTDARGPSRLFSLLPPPSLTLLQCEI